jgi:hypothetical protein
MTGLPRFLKRLAPWLGLLMVVGLWRQRRKGWLPKLTSSRPTVVPRSAVGILLDQVEEGLQRNLGWTRPPGMTLLAWEVQEDSVRLFLRTYCSVFYGKTEPTADELVVLTQQAHQIIQWAASQNIKPS